MILIKVEILPMHAYIHRGPLKKVPLLFYDDFGKCGPIAIILSLLDS